MAGRPKAELVLSDAEREQLQAWGCPCDIYGHAHQRHAR